MRDRPRVIPREWFNTLQRRWRVLLSWVRDTLVGVTEDEVAGLRRRGLLAITG